MSPDPGRPGGLAATPAYKVIGQVEAMGQTAQGQYVPGHKVTVQLAASGTTFSVFVSDSHYNVEAVKQAIAAKAHKVAEVDSLEQ